MKRSLSLLLLLSIALTLSAQVSQTRSSLEAERKNVLKEIEQTNKLLSEIKKTANNALYRLNLISEQITARKKVINLLDKEINSLNSDIASKERMIKNLEAELSEKKVSYANAVRNMYKHKNSQDQLLFILSAEDLAQSYRRMMYMREYSQWRKRQAEEIVEKQQVLIKEKEILEANKKDKLALMSLRKQEEADLLKEESSRKTEVSDLQKDQKKIEANLTKQKKQAEDLQKKLDKIIADEIAASQKAKQNSPQTERKTEIKGGYAMTKEDLKLSGDFASNKGKLPMPLKGSYKIVRGFGVQHHPGTKNVSLNNSGIDIQTTAGNTAKCVFEGEVTNIFLQPGYQLLVFVRHGNYFTIYAYLDEVFVKKGDKVKAGQDLGKIYVDKENGDLTVLHFKLYKEAQPLNPEPWLNK